MLLKTKVIQGEQAGPHLLITAGVHGDEFEGIVAVQRLMRELVATATRGKVTLVPVVNESAFGQKNRCGKDGLDLARTCPGNPQGSVTEQAASALTQLIETADLYVDLHSGGVTMDVYPLAGYMLVESPQVLEASRRMARAFALPLVWGTTDKLDGRSMSAARDAQVPAIYVEYRGEGRCNQHGVEAMINGCRNVMAEFGLLEKVVPEPRQQIVHEDPRPESGHMQICCPAPKDGVFETAVTVGQFVKQGDVLGTLSDPFTGEGQEVVSSQTGSVIVLRTYPQVGQGDALAVVLEDERELPPC
ncbi:MAG: succinylglutamate desuccinylase/aspartoacylase family protein [Planctomycetales bacterium]|nr:succinylglutamate desuccinylase/aspartoacylase family protein [Planctomycetales bacterium]